MEPSLTIHGEEITWWNDSPETISIPLAEFIGVLQAQADRGETEGPLPAGARFLIHRGPATLLVIEEPPQVRVVRWLDDESEQPFGDEARYRSVRLAFPYLVIVAVFLHGRLTTRTQCFYRTRPITGKRDLLYTPNLYNIDAREDMPCWLCLKKLRIEAAATDWDATVSAIRNHVWQATFNRSATLDRTKSYWYKMQRIDPRIAGLTAWEEATRADPLFPLHVRWLPLGQTLGHIMDTMLDKVAAARQLTTAYEWAMLLRRHSALKNGQPS